MKTEVVGLSRLSPMERKVLAYLADPQTDKRTKLIAKFVNTSPATVRQVIHQLRKGGFLTPAPDPVSLVSLTPAAESLLTDAGHG